MAQTRGKTGTQSGKRDTRNIKRKIRKLEEQLEGIKEFDNRVTPALGKTKERFDFYDDSINRFVRGDSGDDEGIVMRPRLPKGARDIEMDPQGTGIVTRYKDTIGKTTTMDKKKKGMKAGGKVKAKKKTTKKFRGDGIAKRGKTKGRFV